MKDFNLLNDESVLQSYEQIRDQVAADAQSGGLGLMAYRRRNQVQAFSAV